MAAVHRQSDKAGITKSTMHIRVKPCSGTNWVALPAYALLFLMAVFPMVLALSYIKLFLFAVVLACVAIAALRTGRVGLHSTVVLWTFCLSSLSFLFALEGFARGGPGAARMAQIYVVWPLIYALVIAGLRSERILEGLAKALAVSTICIAIYSITYLLIQTNILPQNRYFDLLSFDWPSEAFGLHEDYIGMQYPGLNSMFFLTPFCVAALVTSPRHVAGARPNLRLWLWVAVFLSLATVLVSGRRALYLVLMTAPILSLIFLSLQPRTERSVSRRTLITVVAFVVLSISMLLIVLNSVYGVTFSGLVDRFTVGFDFSPTSADQGTTERRNQYHALMAGWMENPILGAGHGMPAYGSIRSPESPWNYELYYVALLYQTGLVGFVAYASGVLWIYFKGVQIIRRGGYLSSMMVPTLVGMTSILIASATNPYLARYDAMWVLFLPLSLVNFSLLHPVSGASGATV